MARPNNSRRKRWTVSFGGPGWDTVAKRLLVEGEDLTRHADGHTGWSNHREFKTARRAWSRAQHLVRLGNPYVRVTHATPCMRYVRAKWILADDRGSR